MSSPLQKSFARRRLSYAMAAVATLSVGGMKLSSIHANPAKTDPVMVVELFTSESCPECPAAEAKFVELRQASLGSHVTLIPLAFHVDYWNQDGWKDPYSDAKYAKRQHAYNGDQLYTPQGVVNGATQELSTSLLQSVTPLPRTVTIDPGPSGAQRVVNVRIDAPASPSSPSGQRIVFMAVTQDSVVSHITAGENNGKDITHVGIVQYYHRIGTVGDTAATLSAIPVPAIAELQGKHAHIVVFVQSAQDNRLGAILGAGTIPL